MALAVCAFAGRVRADTLVFYERPALRPGLCVALRIQLTDLADVRCQPDLAGSPAERIAAASRALDGETRLAVLLEDDARYARMLIVGDAPDRALLAIEPVEARPEPDVDRALALKVRETFERSRSLPVLVPRRAHAAVLEVGGAVSTGRHTRGLGLVALGYRRERARRFEELVLFGRLASTLEDARVREDEWAVGVGGRLGFTRGRLSLGPALDVAIVRVSAVGESARGERGEATELLARVDLALDVRVRLIGALALRFAPALELDPLARSFRVEDDVLALQHVRLLLPLSLVMGIGP